MSWWGPESATDRVIRRGILKHEQASALTGRPARRRHRPAGGFIPVVTPGYNDTQVRRGNAPAPRYFAGEPGSKNGDVFRAMITEAALPNLDASTGNMMLVTSFNEWWEDTQIEATTGKAAPTTTDRSASKKDVTRGYRYEDYGFRYNNAYNLGMVSPPSTMMTWPVE